MPIDNLLLCGGSTYLPIYCLVEGHHKAHPLCARQSDRPSGRDPKRVQQGNAATNGRCSFMIVVVRWQSRPAVREAARATSQAMLSSMLPPRDMGATTARTIDTDLAPAEGEAGAFAARAGARPCLPASLPPTAPRSLSVRACNPKYIQSRDRKYSRNISSRSERGYAGGGEQGGWVQ